MSNKTTAKQRANPAVGKRLKDARESKGIKQSEIAEILGLTTNAYQNYEYGKEISSGRLVQICAVLECSPNWLLGFRDTGRDLPENSLLLKQLREAFDELSDEGQKEALRRVQELSRLEEYRRADTGDGSGAAIQDSA